MQQLTELTALVLATNNLDSVPPLPPNIEMIDLTSNLFIGQIPEQFSQATSLTQLILSYNKLSGTIPTSFAKLTMLKSLSLPGNRFTGELSFSFLTSLLFIDLARNQLTSLLSVPDDVNPTYSVLSVPPNLTTLTAENNLISDIRFPFPGVIESTVVVLVPRSINYLDLSANLLTGTIEVGVQNRSTVPLVNLVNNRLSKINTLPNNGIIPSIISSPQDINECALKLSDCPPHSNCTDGWYPLSSYTCTCVEGYTLNTTGIPPSIEKSCDVSALERQCINIDECKEPYACPEGFDCIDTEGSYLCTRNLIPLYVVVPVAFSFIFGAIGVFYLYRYARVAFSLEHLDSLPEQVTWSWRKAIRSKKSWTNKSNYLYKDLKPGSKDYTRVKVTLDRLSPGEVSFGNIQAVYNPILVSSFVQTYRVQKERSEQSFETFYGQGWKENPADPKQHQRGIVYTRYESLAALFEWNKNERTKILPLVHGTDILYAGKIAETGFASLSSIDEGWYGKGIYFTSFIFYTLPYISKRRHPAIILAWVLPGNVYPVIEHPKQQDSLSGSAIKSRYNSHYVLTGKDGYPLPTLNPDAFDEIIVSQESQIAPAFIISVDLSCLKKLEDKWKKGGSQAFSKRKGHMPITT